MIENIIDIVHATRNTPDDEKLAHLVKLLEATLKTHYAIGRWVPVSERWPEFKSHYWSGYMIEDGVTKHGIRSKQNFKLGDITHWLELDIPEVGE